MQDIIRREFGLEDSAPAAILGGVPIHHWTYSHSTLLTYVADNFELMPHLAGTMAIATYGWRELQNGMPADFAERYHFWQQFSMSSLEQLSNAVDDLIPNYGALYEFLDEDREQWYFLLQLKDFPQNILTLTILGRLDTNRRIEFMDRLETALGTLWTSDMFVDSKGNKGMHAELPDRARMPLAMSLAPDGGKNLRSTMQKRVRKPDNVLSDEETEELNRQRDELIQKNAQQVANKSKKPDAVGPTVRMHGVSAETLFNIPKQQFKALMSKVIKKGEEPKTK